MRTHPIRYVIAAIVALLCPCPAPARAELRVGVYAQDISPKSYPVVVNGDFFHRTAGKLNMPLHARCFVLDDGKSKIVMGVIDSCGAGREILDEIKALASKATGIPAERMMLSCTHTHSAPALGPSLGVGADLIFYHKFSGRICKKASRSRCRRRR